VWENPMHILAKVLQTDRDFDLRVRLAAGVQGLSRRISTPRVQKPGLALAGYLAAVRPECVQVLGNTEMKYLGSLDEEGRRTAIDRLLAHPDLACLVLTNG